MVAVFQNTKAQLVEKQKIPKISSFLLELLWVAQLFFSEQSLFFIIQINVTKRIGNLENGVHDIKNHGWFQHIDWTSLFFQETNAPFVPNVYGKADTTNYKRHQEDKLKVSDTEKYPSEFNDFWILFAGNHTVVNTLLITLDISKL